MRDISQDVRYACRGFRKDPGLTALAIASLALGIGAATAIFSVIDNVLLDPWPYRDADRIAVIFIRDQERPNNGGRGAFFTPEFIEYRKQAHVFEDSVGVNSRDVLYTSREGTERLQGCGLTSNAFDFLGVRPLLGRGIQPDDGRPGAPPVFVLSYKAWLKYFNGDKNLLGKTFVLIENFNGCLA